MNLRKIQYFAVIFVIIIVLASCVQPATIPETATPFDGNSAIPSATSAPTEIISTNTPAQDTPVVIVVTDEPSGISPTPSIQPDEELEATFTPDGNDILPTPTPSSGEIVDTGGFDPIKTFGEPSFIFPDGENGWGGLFAQFPDTDYIKLEIEDESLYVTGKVAWWDTWYLSWANLENFYIDMTVHTEMCGSESTYGFMVHAAKPGELPMRGYQVMFSCDGSFAVYRLDNADPYSKLSIYNWEKSSAIRTGGNSLNRVGLEVKDNNFTLYANGEELTIIPIFDNTYKNGYYGIFVNAGDMDNFTFEIQEMRVWR
ncbi:MAG: hypothetical protein JXA19_01290 [Anaerolineales bacterium]|nr:hypothetical protein [Anaerolineales bacterium]